MSEQIRVAFATSGIALLIGPNEVTDSSTVLPILI
jgi:hypothetical protein